MSSFLDISRIASARSTGNSARVLPKTGEMPQGPDFAALLEPAQAGAIDARRSATRDAIHRLFPLLASAAFEKMIPTPGGGVRGSLADETWRSFLSQELGKVLAGQICNDGEQAVGAKPIKRG